MNSNNIIYNEYNKFESAYHIRYVKDYRYFFYLMIINHIFVGLHKRIGYKYTERFYYRYLNSFGINIK